MINLIPSKDIRNHISETKREFSDFLDASIRVEFLLDNGNIKHSHICPIFLEKYEPKETDTDSDLFLASSDMYRGQCDLNCFIKSYDAFKKQCYKKNR